MQFRKLQENGKYMLSNWFVLFKTFKANIFIFKSNQRVQYKKNKTSFGDTFVLWSPEQNTTCSGQRYHGSNKVTVWLPYKWKWLTTDYFVSSKDETLSHEKFVGFWWKILKISPQSANLSYSPRTAQFFYNFSLYNF